MRTELRRVEPEIEPALQARASAWYADRGDIDRAIEHAVAADDATRTGELLWANVLDYVTRGHSDKVQRWLSGLRSDAIANSPQLALCAAYGALGVGDVALARQWAMAAAVNRTPDAPAHGRSLTTGLAAFETLVARKGATEMRSAARDAYEREPGDSAWRPVLCLGLGVAEHLAGSHAAARHALQEGVDLGASGTPLVASLCLAVDAMIAIEGRDWGLATELTDRARVVIEDGGVARDPLCALVFAASAAACAHDGRSAEAKRDLRTGLEALAELGDFISWYGADARILLGHASLWLADIVGARTLLAEASRLARRVPDTVVFEQWFDEAWAYIDTLAEARLSGPSALTIAELRVLRFLPSHRSFREIALQLGVSANTVKTQAHAVYRKLGAASRSEAVLRASEAGLLGQ
jgi:LuxR family maltose regulon positive regulatory protein